MPLQTEPQDPFQVAFQELAERAVSELDYIPGEYLRRMREHGALQAAKSLLAEAPSNDSLELWVRGNRDLTIEALARTDKWKHLFSDQERMTAERRYADWSFEMAELDTLAGICSKSELEGLFFPEDDVFWGEELARGIDVCKKLAQENASVQKGNRLNANWTLAHYRKHLAECSICADECAYLKQSLEHFDQNALKSLGDLLVNCRRILNSDHKRSKKLLSREWREAGYEVLPSEAKAAGTTSPWKDPSRSEERQLLDWLRVLNLRAGLLCARTGAAIIAYEETHRLQGNAWLAWRKAENDSAVVRFVRALPQEEFVTALLARNIDKISAVPRQSTPLLLPTDGDLTAVEEVITVEQKTDLKDWQEILSRPFIQHELRLSSWDVNEEVSEGEWVTSPSDRRDLDWGQTLYLAWSAAAREASLDKPAVEGPAISTALIDMRDSLESIRTGQTAIFDFLGRIAGNLSKEKKKAAHESLEIALGARIFRLLCPEALEHAISAEQMLHDEHLANFGWGIVALCTAFETELKQGFLARFGSFLTERKIGTFPEREKLESGRWRPLLLLKGRQAGELTLEKIRLALDSPRPEIRQFCDLEGIGLSDLKSTIDSVRTRRNPHAHGQTVTWTAAHRIREQVLGITSGDGGAFKYLFPRARK